MKKSVVILIISVYLMLACSVESSDPQINMISPPPKAETTEEEAQENAKVQEVKVEEKSEEEIKQKEVIVANDNPDNTVAENLFVNIRAGILDEVMKIIDSGVVSVDEFDPIASKDAKTALIVAISIRKLAIVKYLLEKGANPELPDATGKLPMDYVNEMSDDQLSKPILEKLLLREKVSVENLNEYLYTSAGLGQIADIEAALNLGADIDSFSNASGRNLTPLALAASKGFYLSTETLINRGADINKHENGETPLNLAIFYKESIETIVLLLENGADTEIKYRGAFTPKQVAEYVNVPAIIALFD